MANDFANESDGVEERAQFIRRAMLERTRLTHPVRRLARLLETLAIGDVAYFDAAGWMVIRTAPRIGAVCVVIVQPIRPIQDPDVMSVALEASAHVFTQRTHCNTLELTIMQHAATHLHTHLSVTSDDCRIARSVATNVYCETGKRRLVFKSKK